VSSAKRHGALWCMAVLLTGCPLSGSVGWPGSSQSSGGAPSAGPSGGRSSSASEEPPEGRRLARGNAEASRPGNCKPDVEKYARDRKLLRGACWDPPGSREWSEAITVVPGRREVARDIFWFEMPKEGRVEVNYGCVELPGGMANTWWNYEPYARDGGVAAFGMPDVEGKQLAQALDAIDALDLPACVVVQRDASCQKPAGTVCHTGLDAGREVGANGLVQLVVATDVLDAGTPKETRRLPALVDRPTDEVVADLAKRGFTAVKVIEADVSCERGIVCEVSPRPGAFYPPAVEIQLKVRRAKR